MGAENIYRQLKQLALTLFSDIVEDAYILPGPLNFSRCLRIVFIDGSYMEIRISEGKYSFHCDRRMVDRKVFRLDNAPHHQEVNTYPHHFHNGTEDAAEENKFGHNHEERFVNFMNFIKTLKPTQNSGHTVVEKR